MQERGERMTPFDSDFLCPSAATNLPIPPLSTEVSLNLGILGDRIQPALGYNALRDNPPPPGERAQMSAFLLKSTEQHVRAPSTLTFSMLHTGISM